jgi:hypothetical protein
MSEKLDKLKALHLKLEAKLAEKEHHIAPEPKSESGDNSGHSNISSSAQAIRSANLERTKLLFRELKLDQKVSEFNDLFLFKAMNLSGIGLKDEDFGQVRKGKYIQVIAIIYESDAQGKKKARNISLGYFGKGEKLSLVEKNKIIEFVLRWRYEKAFQNVEHYRRLIDRIDQPSTLF